jgi:hypothetical protein
MPELCPQKCRDSDTHGKEMGEIPAVRLARILLRYFPVGLSVICFFQTEMSRYFLMQQNFNISMALDTVSNALLLPFPNALSLSALEFAPSNDSAWYFYMGLVFVLVIGPIALLTGILLERVSTTWPRVFGAVFFYMAISWISINIAVRIAFRVGWPYQN